MTGNARFIHLEESNHGENENLDGFAGRGGIGHVGRRGARDGELAADGGGHLHAHRRRELGYGRRAHQRRRHRQLRAGRDRRRAEHRSACDQFNQFLEPRHGDGRVEPDDPHAGPPHERHDGPLSDHRQSERLPRHLGVEGCPCAPLLDPHEQPRSLPRHARLLLCANGHHLSRHLRRRTAHGRRLGPQSREQQRRPAEQRPADQGRRPVHAGQDAHPHGQPHRGFARLRRRCDEPARDGGHLRAL